MESCFGIGSKFAENEVLRRWDDV